MMATVIESSGEIDLGPLVCPRCSAEQEDYDGFGFLACDACGLCFHPSLNNDGHGNWVCGICSHTETARGEP